MDDDSKFGTVLKWGLGAAGLGVVASVIFIPHYGVIVAIAVLVLFALFFGGWFLWNRLRAKRQREQFTTAIEAQTAATPRTISDPNKRADLDRVRQKFQSGLQEFKSRGKDIYKLPWHVIIGESGSGKTEAIRHSGIDFPPGLQDELQGSGGTVNMDWWFTNRGIILDTAGSMLFSEASGGDSPEWKEFLRLLKRARPHCPVNGLFLVLSVESLIRDSADRIAQKASRIAQQLDLIQRTLDVRFPVYLLVTKCDLLIGFREFFDSIDDPLLQHQMFGWSNPEPLDAHFRPDLVEQHLKGVADRLCRRRMALLREAAGRGDTQQFFAASYQAGRPATAGRRLDEVDGLFALPESVMRLAPRLRRYLETIFVAGEWSAKPVFLRGIYFTSSMREGKALDEAIAQATGLELDQLPEDRNWEKNRAFFLRDLFHEKVFRESGLVTRATNTIKLLRKRQFLIFGTAGVALLLLLAFSWTSYRKFKSSIGKEAEYWQAGAANWKNREWSPAIVMPVPIGAEQFVYGGSNQVQGTKLDLISYHLALKSLLEHKLDTPWLFKPMIWMGFGRIQDREPAQRRIFEGSVIAPLVRQTREKMKNVAPSPRDPATVGQHLEALLALIRLETDRVGNGDAGGPLEKTNPAQKAETYLRSLTSYLTGATNRADTNLVAVFAWTYASGFWPPASLRIPGGEHLTNNPAIQNGLENFRIVTLVTQNSISNEVQAVNQLVKALASYAGAESDWLANAACHLLENMQRLKHELDDNWRVVQASTNLGLGALTSISSRYGKLEEAATKTSSDAFANLFSGLSGTDQTTGIIGEIRRKIESLTKEAGSVVRSNSSANQSALRTLDPEYVAALTNNSSPVYQQRWTLYALACDLAREKVTPVDRDIGAGWVRYKELNGKAEDYRRRLAGYTGPKSPELASACERLASSAVQGLKGGYIDAYIELCENRMSSLDLTFVASEYSAESLTAARKLLGGINLDLNSCDAQDKAKLEPLRTHLPERAANVLERLKTDLKGNAGFPVLLSALNPLDAAALSNLKKRLEQIEPELGNPEWTNLVATPSALNDLKACVGSYRFVADSLVDAKGGIRRFKIFFLPPDPDQPQAGSDAKFAATYRWASLKAGSEPLKEAQTAPGSKDPIDLGIARLDDSITFSFRLFQKDTDSPVRREVSVWALPRLIQSGEASTIDGRKWRVTPKETRPELKGNGAVFVFDLQDSGLPKPEDWPK